MYSDLPARCIELYEFLWNSRTGGFGVDLEELERRFGSELIRVAACAHVNRDSDHPENGPRMVRLIEFGVEDSESHKVSWGIQDPQQLPYRPHFTRARLTEYGHKAVEWRRVCQTKPAQPDGSTSNQAGTPGAAAGKGAANKPGRPKGSKKSDALGRFVKKAAKRLEGNEGSRIPVKQLIDEYKKESGYSVGYETLRNRMRDALGRR